MMGFGRRRVARVRTLGRRGAVVLACVVAGSVGVFGLGSVLFAGAAAGSGSCSASSPYSRAVAATSGVVSFWRLGEASGTSACDTTGSNTGTYQGGYTLGKTGAIVGDAGTATLFNGTSGDVSVPSASSLNTTDTFSIEAWVRRATTGTTQMIASKQTGSWALEFTSGNALALGQATASGMTTIVSSTSTVTDTSGWHYVVATKSGSTVHLYIDGTDVTGTVSNKTLTNNSSALQLGVNGTSSFFNGTLNDVALYNAPLTATQVADHYRLGLAACYSYTTAYPGSVLANSSLIGYWRLGEASGTTACDSTGQDPGVYASGVTLAKTGGLASDPGTAALFNGTSGNVSVPATSTLNVGDTFSIEAWVKRGSTGGSSAQTIAAKQTGAWALAFSTANQLELLSGTSTVIAKSTTAITDTTGWHYVVATKSGSTVHLYIDGTDVTGTITNSTLTNNTSPLQIGENGTSAFLNGTLEEVALYNAALTASQVQGHYANGVIPNLTVPSISGTATDGQTLTAANGTWGGSPTGYSYQWETCNSSGASCSTITGATASTLHLASGQVGSTIRVIVTATNAQSSNAATSTQTATVQAAAPANTTLPSISGTAADGQTLTAGNGAWSGTTPLSYAYQWQRCNTSGSSCTSITGATAGTYTATSADVGSTLRVQVTASNAAGSSPATSTQTATVAATAPVNLTLPAVTGTAQAGQTLTATTGTWSGTAPISYSDQWQRCNASGTGCTNIAGATGSTYQAGPADVGATLLVRVTGTNTAGSSTAPSAATGVVTAVAPANTAAPAITGTAKDGQILTASTGTWSGTAPITYTYQWQRCNTSGTGCANITGATAATYPAGSADVGSTLIAQVTGANAAGSATASSAATPVVAAAAPANSVAPTISGTLVDGQTLTASTGTWSGTAPISYSYQWQRCSSTGTGCATITGATASTYQLSPTDVGTTLDVVVTATNTAGSANATSATTPTVTALAPANTTAPTITGTAQDGQTLTATAGSWSGDAPITYAYQWQRCNASGTGCTNIAGATSSTHAVAGADVGSTLQVTVTASNTGGSSSATSASTAVVTAVPPSIVTLPTVTGTAQDGQTLTASTGTWSGDTPISYTYQWQRCDSTGNNCAGITGATASTYQLSPADVNATVEVIVTAANPGGTGTASSAPTATVTAAPAPTLTNVSHSNLPSGPVASGSDTVTATATSPGPGISQFTITDQNGTVIAQESAGCDGTPGNPCPNPSTQTLTVRVDALPLGQNTLSLVAVDPAGSASAPVTWTVTIVAPSSCTDTWTGATTGSWQDATSWSEGTVPTDHDDACIPAGSTVQVANGAGYRVGRLDAAGTVAVSNGTLAVDDSSQASTVADLSVTASGTLAGAGELDVSGSLVWSSVSSDDQPAMSGPGSTVILPSASATLNFAGSAGTLENGRTLRNEGVLTLSAGAVQAYDAAETIDNATGATMYLNADGYTRTGYYSSYANGLTGSSAARLTNEGSIVKASGTGITTVAFAIDNAGSVVAQSGTLSFAGGTPAGDAPVSGSWGSTDSASLGLDARTFSLGSASFSGQVSITGEVTATDVQAPAGTISVDSQSGETNLAVTSTTTISHVANLLLTGGGILGGAGEIDVSGSLNWSSPGASGTGGGDPTMTGTGSLVIGPGATATLDFANASVGDIENGWTLRNEGAVTLSDGAVQAYGTGETIDNAAGATINLNADGTTTAGYNTWPNGITLGQNYYGPPSTATLTNEGSITKTTGAATGTIGFPVQNTGSITAQSGTLSLTGGTPAGADAASGSWGSSGSGAVGLDYGTFTLGSTSVSGQLNVDGGQVTATDIHGAAANLGITSGTLTITSTSTVSTVAGLSLTGSGTLGGASELDVAASLAWSSASAYDQATMSGPGSTVILPTATATLDFTTTEGGLVNGRTLRNEGTLTLTAGAVSALDGDERIDNAAGATMYLNADGTTQFGWFGTTSTAWVGTARPRRH